MGETFARNSKQLVQLPYNYVRESLRINVSAILHVFARVTPNGELSRREFMIAITQVETVALYRMAFPTVPQEPADIAAELFDKTTAQPAQPLEKEKLIPR